MLLTSDAFGRTHQRTYSGTVTDHHYRGLGEDLAKTRTSGVDTLYALTLGGSPLGQKVGTASASFFLRDPHGDSVGLVSTAAANQATTSYDPYGQVLSSTGTQPLFGYQSDVTDTVTKQVDMGTRWYAPGQGRFSVRDVLWGDPLHPVSLNQWVYGASNPITMWDPTGMRWATAAAAGGGGCGDGAGLDECEAAYEGASQVGGGESAGYDWSDDYVAVVTRAAPAPPEPSVPPIVFDSLIARFGRDTGRIASVASAAVLGARDNVSMAGNALRGGSSWGGSTIARWGGVTRALARFGRPLGVVGTALSLPGDYQHFVDAGDGPIESGVKAAEVAAAGWVGAGYGAVLVGGGCAATVLLAPVSPVCAAVGAVAGGFGASGLVRSILTPPEVRITADDPRYPTAYPAIDPSSLV